MTLTPPDAVVYVVVWRFGDLPPRVACDHAKRVWVFDLEQHATIFADRIASYYFDADVRPCSPSEVVDLVLANDVDPDVAAEQVVMFEAQTFDGTDAKRQAVEEADNFLERVAEEFMGSLEAEE